MLAWSIEAALDSGLFTTVMVSTDDEEIAGIAESLGAEVPFLRSAEASDDFSTTSDVLKEVLMRYIDQGRHFDCCCCLYPTAPFVRSSDLIYGYQQLLGGDFDVIFPVVAYSYPIWRSLKRDQSGRVLMNFPDNLNRRSQDLPTAYHDAGQWYWFNTQAFLQTGVLMGDNTGSIEMPESRVQDIDTEADWELAEIKHSRLLEQDPLRKAS